MTKEKEEKKKKKRKVAFEFIETQDGGIIVQEVYEPLTRSFGFVVYDKKSCSFQKVEEYKNEYSLEEEVLVPFRVPILRKRNLPVVVFANEPKEFYSVKELIDEIKAYIKKYVELKEEDLWIISRFVLHTWIYDVGDYAMQMQVLGDFSSGKTRLLKILRLICYNALMLSGGTSLSAYRRLQSKFQGTLLINEFEPNKSSEDSNELIQWINSGFERDLPIALSNKVNPEKQEFFIPFSPKIFASRNVVENVATRSRLIVVKMEKKIREDVPIELPQEAYEEAEELRNKLLMFRLKYYVPNFVLPKEILEKLQKDKTVDDRFKQNMFPLLILASLVGDKKEVDEVFEFYRKASLDFKKQIAMQTVEGILFNTIIETCNQNEYDKEEFLGYIDEDYKLVAITTNLLQRRLGFSPRTIAKALQRIGLVQERTTKKVIVKFENKEPILKNKVLRKWVFQSEKAWIEACSRYFFEQKDEEKPISLSVISGINVIDIPEILKSSSFINLENKLSEEKSMTLMPDMPLLKTESSYVSEKVEKTSKYRCEDCENFIPYAQLCKAYPERVVVLFSAEYPSVCPFFKLKKVTLKNEQ
jgi:hypothetical protein